MLILLFSVTGFSITVMKADQAILNRLDAPTRAPNWPVAVDGQSHARAFMCCPLV